MLLDPDLLRSKADAFDSGLRGYLKHDVAAYLGRIALAVEVLGEDTGPPPALPADFQPDAIRTHEFDVVWRGLDREEVRAFLTQLADELERRLSSTDTSRQSPTVPVADTPSTDCVGLKVSRERRWWTRIFTKHFDCECDASQISSDVMFLVAPKTVIKGISF